MAAWDRRRWINPHKDQNDEPHMLGQLNLLFDLLEKHGLEAQWRVMFHEEEYRVSLILFF